MKKRLLSTLLTLCMVLAILPVIALPALAAPGDGYTEANPTICNNFAEFKAAMEKNQSPHFILLKGFNETLPPVGALTTAINPPGSVNKTLILAGDTTVWFPIGSAYAELMALPTSATLNIKGTGRLTTRANLSAASNSVIHNVGGTINMHSGELVGSNNNMTHGVAIWQGSGTLNVYGGTLAGTHAYTGSTGRGAVVANGGAINIYGGRLMFNRIGTTTGKGLDVSATSTAKIAISGGSFQYNTEGDITPYLVAGWTVVPDPTFGAAGGVKATNPNEINSVAVTVTAPIAGATPDFSPIAPANTITNYTDWKNMTDGEYGVTLGYTLVSGKTYRCIVNVNPAATYSFAMNATLSINGETATIVGQNSTNITAYCDFVAPLPQVNSVVITVPAPTAGMVSQPASTSTTGAFIDATTWYRTNGSEPTAEMAPTDKFEAGKTYRCYAIALASEGYAFNTGATATINSGAATPYVQGTWGINCYRDFTVPATSVNLNDIKWNYTDPLVYNGEMQTVLLNETPGVREYNHYGNTGTYATNYNSTATVVLDTPTYRAVPGSSVKPLSWSIVAANQKISTPYNSAENALLVYQGSTLNLDGCHFGGVYKGIYSYTLADTYTGVSLDSGVLTVSDEATADAVIQINATAPAYDVNNDGMPEYTASDPIAIYVQVTELDKVEVSVTMANYYFDETPTEPDYGGLTPSNTTISYTGTLRGGGLSFPSSSAPISAGDYTVTVTYKDATSYGVGTATFTVLPRSIGDGNGSTSSLFHYYNGFAPWDVNVSYNGKTLIAHNDFSLSITAVDAGVYPITIHGRGNYTGTLSDTLTIHKNPLDITGATVTPRDFKANDKTVAVTNVTFKSGVDSGTIPLELNKDYIVTGTMADANVGTDKSVTVTVTMLNHNYSVSAAYTGATAAIAKAAAPILPNATALHKLGTTDTFTKSVSGLLIDAGTTSYAKGSTPLGATDIISSWDVNGSGVVTYTLSGDGNDGDVVRLPVTITSANYEEALIYVAVRLTSKETPTVTANNITRAYNGEAVSNAEVTGSASTAGTWSFYGMPSIKDVGDSGSYTVKFVPYNPEIFEVVTDTIQVKITKAATTGTPFYKTIATSGKTLADAALDLGTLSPKGGNIAWALPTSTEVIQGTSYAWIYTPDNPDNFSVLTGSVVLYPSGGGTSGSSGSTSAPKKLIDTVTEAKEGDTVTATLPITEPTLAGEIFEAIAGKEITLEITIGGATWVIDGLDVPEGVLEAVNLGLTLDTTTIPVEAINAITGESTVMQLELNHDGPFGFSLSLKVDMGSDNAGLFANLYYYNPATGAMEFVGAALIGADGKALLPFDHASEYAIVISAESHAPEVPWVNPFTDVQESNWFYPDVQFAVENGLFNGTSDTTFSPNTAMTRGMLVTVLYRMQTAVTAIQYNNPFADVPDDAYYADAVKWAFHNGIVLGVSEGAFAPSEPITRQQAATILARYMEFKGINVVVTQEFRVFVDGDSISDWAVGAVQLMSKLGVITGKPGDVFDPHAGATRAEVAAMLHRFMEAVK